MIFPIILIIPQVIFDLISMYINKYCLNEIYDGKKYLYNKDYLSLNKISQIIISLDFNVFIIFDPPNNYYDPPTHSQLTPTYAIKHTDNLGVYEEITNNNKSFANYNVIKHILDFEYHDGYIEITIERTSIKMKFNLTYFIIMKTKNIVKKFLLHKKGAYLEKTQSDQYELIESNIGIIIEEKNWDNWFPLQEEITIMLIVCNEK